MSNPGCLWPMWPNGHKPTHVYCGKRRRPLGSYCAEHTAVSRARVATAEELKAWRDAQEARRLKPGGVLLKSWTSGVKL